MSSGSTATVRTIRAGEAGKVRHYDAGMHHIAEVTFTFPTNFFKVQTQDLILKFAFLSVEAENIGTPKSMNPTICEILAQINAA